MYLEICLEVLKLSEKEEAYRKQREEVLKRLEKETEESIKEKNRRRKKFER